MTSDRGVASRKILQLHAMIDEIRQTDDMIPDIPFIQLYLERTRVGEHIVICSHTRKDSVDGA